MPETSGRRSVANSALLLASALWGLAFVAQRVAAQEVGPFSFTAVRFALGGIVLLPLVALLDRYRGLAPMVRAKLNRSVLIPGLATGAMLAVAVNLQQVAMADVPAGNAAFITGLYMVFVPVFAAIRGHRAGLATVVGVALSVAGLYLISVTDDFAIGRGEVLLIISTVFWAIQILLIEHFSRRLPALRFASAQFLACAVLSSVGALVADPAPFAGLGLAVVPILYGGLASGGIAYTLQVVGQRHALASHAALIMATEAIFGALGGAVLLGENMGMRGYLGAAAMIAGVLVSQLGLPGIRLNGLTDTVEPRS